MYVTARHNLSNQQLALTACIRPRTESITKPDSDPNTNPNTNYNPNLT